MSEELISRVTGVIAKTQKIPLESVTLDKTFADLNIDSLDSVNILFALEDEFSIEIADDDARKIGSMREIVDGVGKLLVAKNQIANQ